METLLTDEREFPKIHQRDGWRSAWTVEVIRVPLSRVPSSRTVTGVCSVLEILNMQ
jgi:hypothetical protein